MDIKIIRSRRRTIAIQIRDGNVIVRAPYFATRQHIQKAIDGNAEWIERSLAKQAEEKERLSSIVKLTEEEKKALIESAKKDLSDRVAYYAPLVGVQFNRITIRGQKTRWGSCSAQGNLNLNFLLMLAPEEVRDAVVVHELCHLKVMNHSKEFYAEVTRVYPQYKETHKWLKIHGEELLNKID